MTSAASGKTETPLDFTQGWTWALPILLVLPNFLYALYLLRKNRNDTRLSTG